MSAKSRQAVERAMADLRRRCLTCRHLHTGFCHTCRVPIIIQLLKRRLRRPVGYPLSRSREERKEISFKC